MKVGQVRPFCFAKRGESVALYQPTNVFPSSFAGVGGGVIDVTDPLTVSWQVNGSSAMTAYRIQIFENTTASAQVYDSGQTSIAPFYGVTSTGAVNYFQTTIEPSALTGLSNGFASGYKMQITQWWNGGSIQQLSPSFFITRTAPSVSISGLPATIDSRSITIAGNYSQAQGDTLDWFRWELATQDDLDNPIEDSGFIYGTEDIQVTYDGLFTDTAYAVRLTVQTENGVEATTGWNNFSVSYQVSELEGYVDACLSPTEGIVLKWPRVSYIEGVPDGSYGITGGQLVLSSGSSMNWSERNGEDMNLPTPWSIAWSGIVPTSGTAPVWKVTGDGHTLTFSIEPDLISLSMDGNILASIAIRQILYQYTIRMVLTPREFHVYYPYRGIGLYPDTDLYPSPTLYPEGGDTNWHHFVFPLTWEQIPVQSVTLLGDQRCDFMAVFSNEVSGSVLSDLLMDFDFEPDWTLDGLFLAAFNSSGISAGNISAPGRSVTGVTIYRRREGDSRLEFVTNAELNASSIVDEGFRNQNTYTYYVFVQSEDTYVSTPLISNQITPMFWNWTVLDCSQDEDGTYHMEAAHRFRNSVSTDRITNNNAPSLLQNFTPYPLRQPSSYNYKSSTLTGYIGRVDMELNQYIDTVEMAEALYDLSVSTSPKFLRDRKGNLWRIQTNAAVSMQTGDTMVPQPYFGSFPWAEVGSVDGVSIVCTEGDGGWESTGAEEPEEENVTKIVVTAPTGTTVTITNGTATYTEVCYGYVTYEPSATGMWTVTAESEEGTLSKNVNVTDTVSYYVGFVFQQSYAQLVIDAPSGATVTVSGNGYEDTKVVPEGYVLLRKGRLTAWAK